MKWTLVWSDVRGKGKENAKNPNALGQEEQKSC